MQDHAIRQRAKQHATYYEELEHEMSEVPPCPPRIPQARELALIDRYRALFPDAFVDRRMVLPQPFALEGIAVWVGWLPLIEDFLEKLSKFPDAIVVQIKEKFGALTIYVGDPHNRDEVQELTRLVREASVHVCEYCGQPGTNGRMRNIGWFKTLCDACRAR